MSAMADAAPGRAHLLLDGALLQSVPEFSSSLLDCASHYIYQRYGEDAARHGPILLEPSMKAEILVTQLLESNAVGFASSKLIVDEGVSSTHLAQHLFDQHIVQTKTGRQYFLRYADNRVWENLWHVLTPLQLRQLMGPVRSWQVEDRSGAAKVRQRPDEALSNPTRIILDHAQQKMMRHLQEPDDLLAELAEIEPGVLAVQAERQTNWDCARQLCLLLRENHILSHPIRIKAGLLAFKTGGAALHDERYLGSLKAAATQQSPRPLDDWHADYLARANQP